MSTTCIRVVSAGQQSCVVVAPIHPSSSAGFPWATCRRTLRHALYWSPRHQHAQSCLRPSARSQTSRSRSSTRRKPWCASTRRKLQVWSRQGRRRFHAFRDSSPVRRRNSCARRSRRKNDSTNTCSCYVKTLKLPWLHLRLRCANLSHKAQWLWSTNLQTSVTAANKCSRIRRRNSWPCSQEMRRALHLLAHAVSHPHLQGGQPRQHLQHPHYRCLSRVLQRASLTRSRRYQARLDAKSWPRRQRRRREPRSVRSERALPLPRQQ